MEHKNEDLSDIGERNIRVRAAIAFNFDATSCVDELTTRHYISQERARTLDSLEGLLDEVEAVQNDVEQRIRRSQEECGIIKGMDNLRGASHAATDPQLSAAWRTKCDDFYSVLNEHKRRYAVLLGRQIESDKAAERAGAAVERLFKTPSRHRDRRDE